MATSTPFTQSWTFPVDGPVSACRLVADAKLLVGAGSNAHVFDCRDTLDSHVELEGLASPISSLTCDKGCRRVVAGTDGGSLRIWDVETKQVIRTFSNCHRASITSVDFHPYGEYIASASRDSHVRVWDTRKKSCLQVYKVNNASSSTSVASCFMEVVRFGPDGRWVVSGCSKGTMRICDVLAGKQLHELPSVSAPVSSISFHPSRCNIAVSGSNGDLAIWDAEKMDKVVTLSEPGCSLSDWTEQHLVWSGAGGKLERLSTSDWRKGPTLKCSWPQLDDLKCEPDGTIFAAQKQVTSVGVTMIGTPGGAKGAAAAAAALRAPLANRPSGGIAAAMMQQQQQQQPQQQAKAAMPNRVQVPPPPQMQLHQQQNMDENNDNNYVEPPRGVNNNNRVANRMPYAAGGTPPQIAAGVVIGGGVSALESYPLSSPPPAEPPAAAAPQQLRMSLQMMMAQQQQQQHMPQQPRAGLKTEEQAVDEALERSDKMTALLQRRVTHARVFRSLWQQHPDRALVHLEQSMVQDKSDCGAVIDFFICLHQQRVKEKLSVDHVPTILRLVQMVLQEHRIEAFVLSAMQALRYINSKFRGRIEETLRGASAAAPGVDLSMESRKEKATQCYRLLCEVRGLVTQYVARPDAVGEEARVLARDLPS